MKTGSPVPKRTATNIEVGQAIHVLSGPLADFDGTVSEVNAESGKIKGYAHHLWSRDSG